MYFVDRSSSKEADNLGLYSISLDGKEQRQHANSRWGTDYRVSPDGQWLAFIERFNVYLVPLLATGNTVEVGPGNSSLPTAKMSQASGDFIHFSADSQSLHWSVGPTLYTQRLDEAFPFLKNQAEAAPTSAESTPEIPKPSSEKVKPTEVNLGFQPRVRQARE